MPVNDFEKQVQQKMEELQLRPSAVVWEEVEKRIRKEKKRRRFIFWFFLLGVLLLGGTGWWLTNGTAKQTAETPGVAQHDTYKKAGTQSSNTNNTVNKISEPGTNDTKPAQGNSDSIAEQPATMIVSEKNSNTNYRIPVAEQGITSKAKPKKEKIEPGNLKEKEEEITSAGNGNHTVSAVQQKTIDTNANRTVVAETTTTVDPVTTTTKTAPGIAGDDEKITSTKRTDSLIAKTEEPVSKKDSSKTKKNKWEVGVTMLAGSSNKTDGFSLFGAMKSMEAYSQSANPGGPLTVVNPAPNPGNGFAWQLGAYAKRQLTRKTGLSIGINFSTYSTKQKTGTYVDSSGVFNTRFYSTSFDNVYRNGVVNTYTNRYSYLAIPVAFHWQINKGKKMPLVFQNGISFGFLAGTNGLAYNSGSNVFYQDKKSYNKFQFSYQTGLYTKFFNKAKHPLTAGILFNYHFSNLQKVNNYGGNHLSSFGVQLGWLLKK